MILSDVVSFARAQSQTDANGLTLNNSLIFANEALQDFHRRLVARGIDASQLQEAYRDGTVNVGTYLYPTDMLFLKAIELNYANSNAQDYKQAEQVDVANLTGGMSFSWLRQNASTMSPQFDDRGDWYEIFPTPTSSVNVSQMIRIFYYLKPTAYTTLQDTVAYPENLDTALLGWRIAAMYLYSLGRDRIVDGDKFNQKYEERIEQYIATLGKGVQTPLQVTNLPLNGFEF